eukprot:Skav209854  [mRNA]  locus=scaffold1684:63604:66076:+ [translate_table: standard]
MSTKLPVACLGENGMPLWSSAVAINPWPGAIRDQLVPYAVRFYTGEACPDDDGDYDEADGDDEEEESEEEDDDDDDDDEDDHPKGKKFHPAARGKATAGTGRYGS